MLRGTLSRMRSAQMPFELLRMFLKGETIDKDKGGHTSSDGTMESGTGELTPN